MHIESDESGRHFHPMKTFLKWISAFLLFSAATAFVQAEAGPWLQELSVQAGGAFPTEVNHLSDSEKFGPVGGIRYLYSARERFAWGLQADYYHLAAKDHSIDSQFGAPMNVSSTDNAATAEIVGRYTFIPQAQFVPYVHMGLGAAYFHQTSDAQPTGGGAGWADTGTTETRQVQDASSVGFSYSAGIGVETQITDSLVLGLEAAWHILGVRKSDFGTEAINFPAVSLRLGWHFGRFVDE